jgi:hypothetical protein
MTVLGIAAWLARRRPRLHPVIFCAIAVLGGAFVLTEYGFPLTMKLLGRPLAIALGPSRFLTDLNYFLAVFAGICLAWIQRRLRLARLWLVGAMCVACLADWPQWRSLARPTDDSSPPAGFVAACRWIHDHTSTATVVLNRDYWTTYLTWRRTTFMPFPECCAPAPNHAAQWRRLMAIALGEAPPDSPDMTMVKVVPAQTPAQGSVIWEGAGYKVVQVWAPRKDFSGLH